MELRGEVAGLKPLAALVGVDEEMIVEAEVEAAIIIDGADGRAGGEAVVGTGHGAFGEGAAEAGEVGGVVEGAAEDRFGAGRDDGEGAGVGGGEIAGGVNEGEAGETPQAGRHLGGGEGEIERAEGRRLAEILAQGKAMKGLGRQSARADARESSHLFY